MDKKSDIDNPVLYILDGFPIRKVNKFSVSLNEHEYAKFVKAHVASGFTLSIPKILALQGMACTNCGHDNITITISKNLLSTKKSGAGGNVTSRKSHDAKDI